MKRVYRVDAGRLSKARRTPQGGVRLDATAAYSSINAYKQPDGTIRREYFPPDEAKKQAWLDSLDMAELTHGHPPDRVTPANRRHYSVGHAVAGTARYDEAESGNRVEVAVQDENEIASVERGDASECSVGYDCRLDFTPGKTPDGRPYDAIQRDRIANHIALGGPQYARSRDAKGRGAHLHTDGERVMRLDGDDNVIVPREGRSRSKTMFRFDGKDYDLSDAGDVARLEVARDQVATREAAQANELASTKTALGELQAKHDGIATELAATKTVRDDLQARLDGIEVAAVIEQAKKIAPAEDFASCKTAIAVKAAALMADPAKKFSLDGQDLTKPEGVGFVTAAFALRLGAPAERQDGLAGLRQAGAPVPPVVKTEQRQDQRQDGRSAYERNRDRLHAKSKTKRGHDADAQEG